MLKKINSLFYIKILKFKDNYNIIKKYSILNIIKVVVLYIINLFIKKFDSFNIVLKDL